MIPIDSESTVGPLDPADESAWDAFVGTHARSTTYHRLSWRNVIQRSFGHQTHYLVAKGKDGCINGVLPLVRLKSRLFGDFLVSMPYFNYGGPLAASDAIELDLMTHAIALARDLGVGHIEFREMRARESYPVCRTDKAIFELELPSTSEQLFDRLGTKKRTRIRRPAKAGATVTHGGAELLDEFYAVFSRNMLELGTPVYGRRFFREVLVSDPDSTTISVVRMDGRPVAAALLVAFRDRLEIPWASALKEYNKHAVNMLLYWEVLKLAIERGFRVFDFGRSTVNSTHQTFKEQWGARSVQSYWNYWIAPGRAMPQLSPTSGKYSYAIDAWKRLPLPIANLLGPHIVKYIP